MTRPERERVYVCEFAAPWWSVWVHCILMVAFTLLAIWLAGGQA